MVERATSSRARPRGASARAYAASLSALGHSRRALDALSLDFRRGGDVRSLVALADLERHIGWRGVAAHHYARVLALDRDALAGRTEVCALLRERARAYIRSGEGEAADADMRRVAVVCPDARSDATLRRRADAAAQALVDARIAQASALPLSPISGVRGAQVSPDALLDALVADARGQLGPTLLDDDSIREWVGGQRWADLAPAVMSRSDAVAAYAKLRLGSIVPDGPHGEDPQVPRPQVLDRWSARALGLEGVQAWRIYALTGDIATAELELAARWKPPKSAALGNAGAHWAARLPPTEPALAAGLTVARLRAARGQEDLALTLARTLLARARAANLATVDAHAHDEVVSALGWGKPWQALALLETGSASGLPRLRGAAATAIAVSRAVCGGACSDDEDRAAAARVLGDAWVAATEARVLDWALARPTDARAPGRCPTVAEVLAPEATGPLAEALRLARADARGPGVGDAWATAIAADVGTGCAAPLALPAMAAGDHVVSARRLTNALAQAPEMLASGDLATHAKLAMIAGESDRALLLSIAAAGASVDSRAAWVDLARFAARSEERELELRAWREALMATPTGSDRAIELRMVVLALEDVALSWGQGRPAGADATRRHVTTWVERQPAHLRWRAEEDLLAEVAEAPWAQRSRVEVRARLAAAVLGDRPTWPSHRRAVARFAQQDPGPAWGPFHPTGLADDVRAGRLAGVPPVAAALGDPVAFEATRAALAASAGPGDGAVRRRMAASLVVLGSPGGRRLGWAVLTEMAVASPHGLSRLESLLLRRPVALKACPGAPSAELDAVPVQVVLGLDLAPSRWHRTVCE